MGNWIYKAERIFDHQVGKTIPPWEAYAPGRTEKSVDDHITHGSHNTRYLSATTALAISALKHCLGTYNSKSKEGVRKTMPQRRNLLLIDWDKLETRTFDCSDKDSITPEFLEETGLILERRAVTNASADREIVIQDRISAEAGRVVPPILVDFLVAIDQKALYNNDSPQSMLEKHIEQIDLRKNAIKKQFPNVSKIIEDYENVISNHDSDETVVKEPQTLIEFAEGKLTVEELDMLKEYSLLDGKREKINEKLQGLGKEVKQNPDAKVVEALIDVINQAIFDDNAKELLDIINQIEFRPIEEKFIKRYYDSEKMPSMEVTAEKMKLDHKEGNQIACGIRGDVIRKILSDTRVKDYLLAQVKQNYPEQAKHLEEMMSKKEFSDNVIFPLPGLAHATSKSSQDSNFTIATGVVSNRTWLPYGVEYNDDGTIAGVINKSYFKGKLGDKNIELEVSENILRALDRGLENPPISFSRINRINQVSRINLSIKDLQENEQIDTTNLKVLFQNPEKEPKLRKFLDELRKLRDDHSGIEEVTLDQDLMWSKCLKDRYAGKFEFINQYFDFIDTELQERLFKVMISKNQFKEIQDIFGNNFLGKDKKDIELTDEFAKALLKAYEGKEGELLTKCLQGKCNPDVLQKIIDTIPLESRGVILSTPVETKRFVTKSYHATLLYTALETENESRREDYVKILLSNGAEVNPNLESTEIKTGKKTTKRSKNMETLLNMMEKINSKKDKHVFVLSNDVEQQFLSEYESGKMEHVSEYFASLSRNAQIQVLVSEADKGNTQFVEQNFPTFYCDGNMVLKKSSILTDDLAKKIVEAEKVKFYSKGRTLAHMVRNDYSINGIRLLIENGSYLDRRESVYEELNECFYRTGTEPLLYTCMQIKDPTKRKEVLTLMLQHDVNIDTAKTTYVYDREEGIDSEIVEMSRKHCLDINKGELEVLINELGKNGQLTQEQIERYSKQILQHKTFNQTMQERAIKRTPKTHQEQITDFFKERCGLDEKQLQRLEQEFQSRNLSLYDANVVSLEDIGRLALMYNLCGIEAEKYCNFAMLTKKPEVIYSRIKYYKEKNIQIDVEQPKSTLGISKKSFEEIHGTKIGVMDPQKYLINKYPLPETDDILIDEIAKDDQGR